MAGRASTTSRTRRIKRFFTVTSDYHTARRSTERSVGHRVYDVICADLIGQGGHWNGIIRIVGMLPGVAGVHIKIDDDHQAVMIVINSAPMLRSFHLRDDLASICSTQMPLAGDLRPLG